MSFWREAADGVTVMVKVHPKSRRPGLGGEVASAAGTRLKIAVTEAAEDGKANKAVCDMLAKALDQPRGAVRILTGASHREKVLTIRGDPVTLAARLGSL